MIIKGIGRVLNIKGFKVFALGMALALSNTAVQAGFEVMESEPAADYGNAQNEVFRRAVESEEPLTSSDRSFLANAEEKRYGQRWYWKAMIARPTAKLKMVSNDTAGVRGQPANRSTKDDIFHFTIALGYKWIRWAAEMELLIAETFDYNTNPALINPVFLGGPPPGTAIKLSGDVKHFALFGNVEYEIPTFFDFIPKSFHPYINVGIGTAIKTTDSQTFTLGGAARQTKSSRSNDFAWHGGLGFKYQVTSSLLIDIAYRWMMLGDVKFGVIEGLTLKARDLDTNGFYIGLTYQR